MAKIKVITNATGTDTRVGVSLTLDQAQIIRDVLGQGTASMHTPQDKMRSELFELFHSVRPNSKWRFSRATAYELVGEEVE